MLLVSDTSYENEWVLWEMRNSHFIVPVQVGELLAVGRRASAALDPHEVLYNGLVAGTSHFDM